MNDSKKLEKVDENYLRLASNNYNLTRDKVNDAEY